MTPVLAHLAHARALGYCARGLRRWFEGRDYTYSEFIFQGVPTRWLRATDDAMAIALAELAEQIRDP